MARFNEILTGRYNRAMQKLLSMKGPASLVTLSDELFAVIPLFYGAENRYLEGWERFIAALAQTAVAANNSTLRLRNPPGSNVMVVVESLLFGKLTSGTVNVNFLASGATDLATTNRGTATDPRGRPQSTAIFSNAAVAAGFLANGYASITFGAATGAAQDFQLIGFENQEIPLLPGGAIEASDTTVNESFHLNVVWRERFLEESERT